MITKTAPNTYKIFLVIIYRFFLKIINRYRPQPIVYSRLNYTTQPLKIKQAGLLSLACGGQGYMLAYHLEWMSCGNECLEFSL